MNSIGDQFLEILSSRRSMLLESQPRSTDSTVRSCLDSLCESRSVAPIDYRDRDQFARWRDDFVSSGFARIDWSTHRLEVESPALTMLPVRAADQALLIGARTSGLIDAARCAASRLGVKLLDQPEPLSTTSDAAQIFLPTRIIFTGDRVSLARLASELGLHWFEVPLAFQLASRKAPGPTEAFTQVATLMPGSSWFNPKTLSYDGVAPTSVHPIGLCRYTIENQNGRRRFDLYQFSPPAFRATHASDVRAAKWRVLSGHGFQLPWFEMADQIAVPVHCPLPVSYSRVLTLCSGKAPLVSESPISIRLGLSPSVTRYIFYSDVHPVIASELSVSIGCPLIELNQD